MPDPTQEPIPHERRAPLSDGSRASAFIAGARAAVKAIGRILIGVTLLVGALALLGVEMQIALDVKTSPHWIHIALYVGLILAAASILLPEWAKTFFGWLIDLVRSARGGRDGKE